LKPKVSTNLIKLFVRSKQEYALTSIADMGGGLNQTLEIAQAGALRRCVGVPLVQASMKFFFLPVLCHRYSEPNFSPPKNCSS